MYGLLLSIGRNDLFGDWLRRPADSGPTEEMDSFVRFAVSRGMTKEDAEKMFLDEIDKL